MQNQTSALSLAVAKAYVQSRIGYGSSNAHHGEILQGVLAGPQGRLRRGLVSLSCGLLRSDVSFFPNDTGTVSVAPAWKVKACRAAELTLTYINAPCSGHLHIDSNIPPSWGLGSSTSDVTATIRAVGNGYGLKLPARIIAKLAVQAEIASDASMFGDQVVLFGHRDGELIEDFGNCLPPLEVIGFNTDITGLGVDTLSLTPVRYSWWEIEAFRPLVGMLRLAVETQDAGLIGRVASASARLNQKYLPKPYFDELDKLTAEIGALGIQVAHSGTVVGILFNPTALDLEQQVKLAKKRLSRLGFDSTWRFRTHDASAITKRKQSLINL